MSAPGADPEARFRRALVGAVAVLSLLKVVFHEPWYDERGPWGVALASDSYLDYLRNLRYGGHPVLWHSLVYAIQRTLGVHVAVQLLQALLAIASAYVVARWAPFDRVQRTLVVFGYFPFFEYGTLARPYGITVLATCVACALWVARPQAPLPLAATLAVLANTTVYGLFLALAFAAAWTLDAFGGTRLGRARPAPNNTALAGLLLAFAAALAVAQMRPPADSGFAVGWHLEPDLARAELALRAVARGIVPVPQPIREFWNTALVDLLGGGCALAGASIFVGVALLLRGRRPALLLWCAATAAVAAFTYAKLGGSMRHHGHVFLALFASSWIAAAADAAGPTASSPAARARRAAIGAVLAVHAVAGVAAVGADAVLPFSRSGDTARFLRESGLDRLPIVGNPEAPAASVAAALGKPIHFPVSGRTTTYVVWDDRRRRVSRAEVLAAAERLRDESGEPVVLLLNLPLDPAPEGIELAARFGGSVVAQESYYVYVDRRTR